MFSSIRAKLTLWYIIVLAIIITAFSGITYSIFVRVLQDETNANMSEMVINLNVALNAERSDDTKKLSADEMIRETLNEFHFRDYQFAVFSHDNRLIAKTITKDLPIERLNSVRPKQFIDLNLESEQFSVLKEPFHFDDHNYSLYLFFSRADQIAIETRLQRIFLLATPLFLLFAGLGGYFLARKGLSPITELSERAKNITADNVNERMPVKNANDEVGNLAVSFNSLLDRLYQEFEKQRRFMADASHELRTPLAIVRGESEIALAKKQRSINEYKESLKIVNDEGKRLTRIVDDLFTLARADSGDIQANFHELYVDEIVAECVKSVRTLAKANNVTINFSGDEMKMRGDESMLRRLFLNLIDNAVKYNHKDGRIDVLVADGMVNVVNTGPEIPEKQREMIFERFYRVDKSRSRQLETMTSGAGLGLSIAKLIAETHNADLKLTRSENNENIFSVIFPR